MKGIDTLKKCAILLDGHGGCSFTINYWRKRVVDKKSAGRKGDGKDILFKDLAKKLNARLREGPEAAVPSDPSSIVRNVDPVHDSISDDGVSSRSAQHLQIGDDFGKFTFSHRNDMQTVRIDVFQGSTVNGRQLQIELSLPKAMSESAPNVRWLLGGIREIANGQLRSLWTMRYDPWLQQSGNNIKVIVFLQIINKETVVVYQTTGRDRQVVHAARLLELLRLQPESSVRKQALLKEAAVRQLRQNGDFVVTGKFSPKEQEALLYRRKRLAELGDFRLIALIEDSTKRIICFEVKSVTTRKLVETFKAKNKEEAIDRFEAKYTASPASRGGQVILFQKKTG